MQNHMQSGWNMKWKLGLFGEGGGSLGVERKGLNDCQYCPLVTFRQLWHCAPQSDSTHTGPYPGVVQGSGIMSCFVL